MLMAIQQIFDWPKIRDYVRTWLKSCIRCRRFKSGRERMQGLQRVNPIKDPFQAVHIDFFEEDDLHIMTMIDRATRWAEASIVQDKSATTAVSTLLHCWISRFGVPEVIVSDNDKAFNGRLARSLYLTLGIKGCTTIVRHPQGNSPVESFHKLLRSEINNLRTNERLQPQEYLDTVLLTYRSSYHTGIRETPAFLTYGRDISFPAIKSFIEQLTDVNEERTALLYYMRKDILDESWKKAQRHAEEANTRRPDRLFELGDLILLRDPTCNHNQPLWSLPHRVMEVLSQGHGARAEDLTTGKVREVHLENARFIECPRNPIQIQEWLDDMSRAPEANPETVLKTMRLLQLEGVIQVPEPAQKRRRQPDITEIDQDFETELSPYDDGATHPPPTKLYRINEGDEDEIDALRGSEINQDDSPSVYVAADSPFVSENDEI